MNSIVAINKYEKKSHYFSDVNYLEGIENILIKR